MVTTTDLDLGLAILRLALGPMLMLHGWNKVAGPGGLGGTAGWFESLGLRPGAVHARLAAGTELLAGALLTLGALTGLACAAFVGLMSVASLTDHRGKGYFIFKGGSEYVLLVGMAALGIAALGPGRWSLDHALGLDLAGSWWALFALVAGGLTAAGLLLGARRLAPPSTPSTPPA
ncbi:MAG: DoxX family protein [Nocardioides sp.]|uniref:DoxX family protein n=1 Tax=Nocardioides sp. TaxID=35761 RepID=UPI0039E454C9